MAESHEEWQPYVYTFGGKRRVVSSRVHCRYHQSGRQFSPRIWRGVYIVGKVLTSFLFRALEDFIYVFIRPFLPGRYGQCGTPLGEVIHRGALFCWFLVLIIIGLPLALLGCILRVVAVSAGKKDFTFVRPATQQPPLLADNDDITITLRTQNIGFLPTVSPANGLATPMKRVRALLADLQSGLDDVVCLQEEFDLDVCDYLLAHLRDSPEDTAPSGDLSLIDEVDAETASLPHNKERSSSFPNNTSPPGKYGWMIMDVDGKAYRLNSGLFVASRYPLEAPEFVRYHVCTNEDVLAGKGVLACTVVVGETSTGQKIKITIFTTHAQAGRQRRAARVRAIQYEMVMHFIDYYNKKHIGPDDILVSSIFMGDFNFSPIMPRPSAITGKLVTCMEWLPNKALFHKHHFMNNFYEHSRDGEKRARNRELIFQIQDLFHAEGARLLLERRTASLPHPGRTSLADLSTASGSGAATILHVPLEAKSVGDSSSSGGRLSAGKGDDDEDDGEEEEEDDDDEEEEEEEEEEGEGGGWSEVMYGGEGSSEASANGQDYRMEREEKIWKMDVATLIRVLQVWAERRAQATKDKPDAVASPAATASDGDGNEGSSSSTSESDLEADLTQLIKCELVRQLRVRKKVFVTEDEINVRSIIPLALQLRLVARRSDQSSNNSSSSSGSSNNSSSRVASTEDRKGKEKAAEDLKGLNRGGVDSGSLDSGEDVEMGSMRKRKRADTGTGIWAGAYEPLIPGTILDTRKYAGKFSQRVRFNDIDHVLMKKHIPGKHVSVTKGRISIVWEGVNTFSDHYGKRLTLSVNVAKLMAKRKRDPSTSPRPDEEEVPLPSGTTVRSSRESEKKNKKKQDRKPPQPAAEADSDST